MSLETFVLLLILGYLFITDLMKSKQMTLIHDLLGNISTNTNVAREVCEHLGSLNRKLSTIEDVVESRERERKRQPISER